MKSDDVKAGTVFHPNVEHVDAGVAGLGRRSQGKGTQVKGWVGQTAVRWPAPARTISKDRRRQSTSAVDLATHVVQMEDEARAVARLEADRLKNAHWQSVSATFMQKPSDLTCKPGPKGFLPLRDTGSLVVTITAKSGKTASLTDDGQTITRKNLRRVAFAGCDAKLGGLCTVWCADAGTKA